MQFPADRGAANIGITLQDGHFEPRLGEVGTVGEAIVARTNDDRVVLVHCTLR